MDPITLDQLRVLQAVVDEGSFSAAARSLRRAQSAVSYGIANLERLLGIPLFDRSGRRPLLTDAGRAVLGDARGVALQVEQLQARARSIASGVEARVAFSVDALFPMPALIDAVGAFRDAWPQVALVVNTETLGAVAQQIVDGVCELAVAGPLPRWPSGLVRVPLPSIEMVHVVAEGHPLARHRGPIAASAVREHVQLVLSDRSRLTDGVEMGVVSPRVWRLADLSTRHAFVRAGFGWCAMPRHAVRDDLRAGRLVEIKLADWVDPAMYKVPLFAIHRADRVPGPAGRWLLERLGRAIEGCAAKCVEVEAADARAAVARKRTVAAAAAAPRPVGARRTRGR